MYIYICIYNICMICIYICIYNICIVHRQVDRGAQINNVDKNKRDNASKNCF